MVDFLDANSHKDSRMTLIDHLIEALLEKIWNDPWLFLEFALTEEEMANV